MMIHSILRFCVVFLCACLTVTIASATEQAELPVIDGEPALATVNGEPITLGDLLQEMVSRHREVAESDRPEGRQDLDVIVELLVDIRLVLQEARGIGLDTTPDYQAMVASFEAQTLRDMLLERHLKEITSADPERVEQLYREKVGELRIRSIFIEDSDVAAKLETALQDGASFDELAARLVEEGKAQGGDESPWVPASELLPPIREAAWALEPGEVSALIRIRGNVAVFRLIDKRVPDDPQALADAEHQAIGDRRMEAARQYTQTLKDRYAKIDEALLAEIDYEAEGVGVAVFLEDERTVATVDGGEPVTVAELSEKLRAKSFHGIDQASARERLNQKKMRVLQDLLDRRVVVAEARRLELDKSPKLTAQLKAFEKRMLFEAFVEKAINPDIDPTEEDLRAFYEEHLDKFTVPARIRMEALAFTERADAENALSKLVSGADLGWMRANARGQADPAEPAEGQEPLPFDGRPVDVERMPEALQKAVSGASSGDYRFYAGDDGRNYVVRVRDLIPAEAQRFEVVRGAILKRVAAQQQREALEAWVAELRKVSEIEVFLTGDALRAAVGMDTKPGE